MIKKVRKSYNTLKWVAGILFCMILLLIAASLHLSSRLKPIIKTQIKELVLNGTDSLYRIEFSDIGTNFITGQASLSNVKISPDTNVLKKLITERKAPNNIYYIVLKRLVIKNFHPVRLLRDKKLNIDLLLFDNPDVVMVNKQYIFNDSKRLPPNRSSYNYISKYLKELRVRTVDLRNIRFKYVNNNLVKPETNSIKNLNITLKDWLIDSTSANDGTRLYLLKDVIINLNDYMFATPDSLYHINLNQLNFKASTGKLNIKSFSVVPRYSEIGFGQVAGFGKDRFNIQLSDVGLEGINLPLYIRKQELYAKEMNIANGFLEVFNNNGLPKKDTSGAREYPHQLLQKMKEQFTVKQLNLNNVDIAYVEFDHKSKQRGEITFEKTSGTITNITNAEKVKAGNPFMFVNLSSYLMGKGKLDVKVKFNLLSANGAFSYSGVLGQMDGRVLNRITKPLGKIEVKRGKVKKLEFNIEANDDLAKGELKFAFNDLSVGLLKKEAGKEKLVKKGLMSILANAMVINSDNPNSNGVFITVPVHYERVKAASFFNFIWKTLFQGIKYSIGMTAEKEKKIHDQIAKFEKMKTDRDKRRAERQRRKVFERGGKTP